MEQKLDFSLPKKQERKGISQGVLVVLLLVAVCLSAASLYVALAGGPGTEASNVNVSFEQAQDLAGKLAQRGLYDRAAIVLEDAVSRTKLGGTDLAKAYFQMAGWLADAGRYGEAIENYYRSEMFGKVVDEQEMNRRLKECFERLGKFTALEREIAARTSMGGESPDAVVVAEIGTEKITADRLDEMIEERIDLQMARYAQFMSPEQISQRKKEMVRQFAESAGRRTFLEEWLSQELLYREAMAEGVMDKPDVKRQVHEAAKGIAAGYMVNREVGQKVNVTDTDARNSYEAYKTRYTDPAKATISHILVDDEAAAKEVIEKAKGGADFAELAKEHSKDADTRDKGGKVDVETVKGEYVAGIGRNKELNDKIFAMKEAGLIDEPVKTDKGWEVVKVDTLTPERQKSFDEVKEQVFQQLHRQKTSDMMETYIKGLMDKFNVVVHTSVLGGRDEGKSE